jgi:hypothetical protein
MLPEHAQAPGSHMLANLALYLQGFDDIEGSSLLTAILPIPRPISLRIPDIDGAQHCVDPFRGISALILGGSFNQWIQSQPALNEYASLFKITGNSKGLT